MSGTSHSRLRSELGRVRGLGSAKHGGRHWWLERLSALALIPLSIWFLSQLLGTLMGASYTEVAIWLGNPLTALALAAFTAVSFWHTRMGLSVIVEDYVHHEGRKLALLIVKDTVVYVLLAGTLAAIAKLHFAGI